MVLEALPSLRARTRRAGVRCLSVGSPTTPRCCWSWPIDDSGVNSELAVSKARIAMSRKRVKAIGRKFPGAELSDPWGGGHDAWKAGGKMFACIGAVMTGVSVKTDSFATD
jgi:hypothetical protein